MKIRYVLLAASLLVLGACDDDMPGDAGTDAGPMVADGGADAGPMMDAGTDGATPGCGTTDCAWVV